MKDGGWWLLLGLGGLAAWAWWASQPRAIWTQAQETAHRNLVASAQAALSAGNTAAYEELLNAADMMKARAGLAGLGIRL